MKIVQFHWTKESSPFYICDKVGDMSGHYIGLNDISPKWSFAKDTLPSDSRVVIAAYKNELSKPRRVRAIYARKFEIEANIDDTDYFDESEDGNFYIKEGWYEASGVFEDYMIIDHDVLCWCELPKLPEWF